MSDALETYRKEILHLVERRPDLFGSPASDGSARPPMRAAIAELGAAGLLAPAVPAGPDRAGESVWYGAVLHETLAPYPAGAAVLTHAEVGARLLTSFPDIPARDVREVREGRRLVALAVTEPGGGLDFDGMSTTVEPAGPALEIDGEKWFCSNSPFADDLLVLARDRRFDASAPGRHTLVRVPTGSAGVGITELETLGHRGLTGHIRLENVQLGEDAVLGAPGSGLLRLMRHWTHERVMLAVRMTSMAAWLLSGVRPGAAHGHTAALVGPASAVAQERAAYTRALGSLAAGGCSPREAAGCKLRAGRLLRETADAVFSVHGADGSELGAVERVVRDALGLALAGGSEEALLMQIARSLR